MQEKTFIVHEFYLLLALIMLWIPRSWLKLGKRFKRRRRQRETLEKFAQEGAIDPEDKSIRLSKEFKNSRNYVDFFRASAGAIALWSFSIETHSRDDKRAAFLICCVLMLIGFLIQTIRRKQELTFYTPIFFAAGMSIGMGNYYSGAMAFMLTCALNPILTTPQIFLAAYALVLLPFNYYLGAGLQKAFVNAGVILFPIILSVLLRRPMVMSAKRRKG